MVTLLHGGGLHALQVGTGTRLGHGDGADALTGDHLRQVLFFQELATVVLDVGSNDFGVQAPADAGQAQAGNFFIDHHAVQEVGFDTTILFLDHGAQETLLTGFKPYFTGNNPFFFPFFVEGNSFGFQELANGIAEGFVVRTEQRTRDHESLRSRVMGAAPKPDAAGAQNAP